MTSGRFSFAVEHGGLTLPEDGKIVAFGPTGDADFAGIDPARLDIVQPFLPDFERLSARGFTCLTAPQGPYTAAIICLPRTRGLAEAWIAHATRVCPEGLIIADGSKTDGIESLLKATRKRIDVAGQVSKAHGRVFWFDSSNVFEDWAAKPRVLENGFQTAPGVFSADGPDPASVALAQALPTKLGKQVADLGGGWGYLAAQALQGDGVETVHVVEADAIALDCARANLVDSRVAFHWADATQWSAPEPLDTIIMNPPFHNSRKGEPSLGQAFIRNAARNLKPSGNLWMVANRHLPYETTLAASFRNVAELPGTGGFKIFHATHPTRLKR